MATMMKAKKQVQKKTGAKPAPIPRATRERVLRLLQENYSYMDSPTFRRKYVEERAVHRRCRSRELPVTSWYPAHP